MTLFPRLKTISFLALSVALMAAGCHKNQDQNTASDNQASTQEPASDPASANLAPVSDTGGAASAPATDTSTQPASDQSAGPQVDEASYGEQPAETAAQAPPELPDYDQPPTPGDGYLWTPGYWAWGATGYYWVPGAWVEPPYQGALWTPGYWAYRNNRYAYYRGYWGRHIGYYGGVNYGYGYAGVGYQGGYWNGNSFFYNREVNNVNVSVVHNVYDYHVVVRNQARVSFNGGPGGIMVRPRPAELAAWREPHATPMRTQLAKEHAASLNRAQFYNTNHGRPESAAVREPIAADRGERAQEARPMERPAPEQHRAAAPQRQAAPVRHEAAPQRREAAPQRHEAAPHGQAQHKPDEHHPQR